jgi:xylulokinase
MADTYLIAHDLGTSGTKAALTDLRGCVVATAERRYPVYYSADGGAEQDPHEWWQAIAETTRQMMAKAGVTAQQIAGMSMSAQMVGTVPVDKDGNPLRRVMIWLDSRAEAEAAYLREITELPFIGGKAPSAKVLWIKRHEPEIYARTYKMLDCKDYLQFRMTGVYGTDFTLSSATTMFNPWEMGWWTDVLGAMEVPVEMLPEAMPSTQVVGYLTASAAEELGLKEGIPVVSGGGDVPCAIIGSGAISVGRVHLYLGTSAWVIAVAPEFNMDAEGVTPGVGCDPNGFMLGGEMDNAGGCLKWFNETLFGQEERLAAGDKGISVYQLMDEMAASITPGSEGLLFLPWVWGERAPVDDDNVRGGFVNLGLNHTKAHMVRAILEGIGYHLRWIFETVEKAGIPVKEANVIGGGAASSFWLQLLADVTGVKLLQVEGPLDACARGAAMTAAVGLGYYKDFQEVEKVIQLSGAEFTPHPQYKSVYDGGYANFRFIYQPLSDIGNKRLPVLALEKA